MRYLYVMLLLTLGVLTGCGSPVSTGGTGGGGGVVGSDTMTMTMSTTALVPGGTAVVTVKLVDGTGAPIANELILFSSSLATDTISGFGVSRTNANGIASVTLTAGTVGGTATLTASSPSTLAVLTYTVSNGAVALAITDKTTGLPISNLTLGSPATVTATVTDGTGAAVVGGLVTFATTTPAIGTVTPTTALTDATGQAVTTLDGVAAGADNVTATVDIGGNAVTGTATYSVGAAVVTMSALTFGVNPLSANGSTSVSVDVFSGGVLVTNPVAVTFSSTCSVAGTATLSSPVTTVGGTATATYTDVGCGGVDVITASVAGVSVTGNLTITPPATGSILFVSAVPAQIALKGTGGLGLQETSVVTFKVLDSGANVLAGKLVNFALSTTVGGITLSQTSGTTDALGQVAVSVSSGTVSTPVRVIATTLGGPAGLTTLQTQSDVLTITTGIPDQDSASLSATTLNIEGWNVDGTPTVLTMRLADHFNNPVPDGTAVNFTTEGGQIVGTCSTTGGACPATLTSSNPRPVDGRITVLAYAVGEESFTDLNGNGLADSLTEMASVSDPNTDLGEAFVDYDESSLALSGSNPLKAPNGIEPFIDFDNNGAFTTPDSKYSGVLCNPAAGTFCAPSTSVNVRDSIVIVFSSSVPAPITITAPLGLDLGSATIVPVIASDCNTTISVTFRITDVNGNAMPAGTTISFATSNGTLTGTTSFVVPNTSTNVIASPTSFDYTAYLISDATFTAAVAGPPAVAAFCSDSTPTGILTVTITTPVTSTATLGSVTITN